MWLRVTDETLLNLDFVQQLYCQENGDRYLVMAQMRFETVTLGEYDTRSAAMAAMNWLDQTIDGKWMGGR